jgi:hypothetical protein
MAKHHHDQFDLFGARSARDEGMEAAMAAEERRGTWQRNAMLTVIATTPPGWEGLGERLWPPVRARWGEPHVQQMWGILASQLIKGGWFIHINETKQCEYGPNHARTGLVLRRVGDG